MTAVLPLVAAALTLAASTPAPSPAQNEADSVAADDPGGAFFHAGQTFVGGASSLALEGVDGSGGGETARSLRFAVDVDLGRFLTDRWALGGSLGLLVHGQGGQTSLQLGVGPTIAASFSLRPSLAFWPRLGVLLAVVETSVPFGQAATNTGATFDLLLPVVVQLNGGLGLRMGPHLAATVYGAAPTATFVTYGLNVGLVGWR